LDVLDNLCHIHGGETRKEETESSANSGKTTNLGHPWRVKQQAELHCGVDKHQRRETMKSVTFPNGPIIQQPKRRAVREKAMLD
jgi:hypothetical protein